ncbi:MAG: nuclear transport factor 2 family protein [Spirochaetota bacterium]
MKAIDVITGKEEGYTTKSPIGSLVEFYNAFNSKNMELMLQNWYDSPHASMSNPLGGIKRGCSEIKQVYEKIFHSPAEVYVEYYDFTIFEMDGSFQAVGRERGYFKLAGRQVELKIRTSRCFVQVGERFRQLHHHGSIEFPESLANYQNAVRTGD